MIIFVNIDEYSRVIFGKYLTFIAEYLKICLWNKIMYFLFKPQNRHDSMMSKPAFQAQKIQSKVSNLYATVVTSEWKTHMQILWWRKLYWALRVFTVALWPEHGIDCVCGLYIFAYAPLTIHKEMVREQQECGYSRREEKQGARGNERTGSAPTKQATVWQGWW